MLIVLLVYGLYSQRRGGAYIRDKTILPTQEFELKVQGGLTHEGEGAA